MLNHQTPRPAWAVASRARAAVARRRQCECAINPISRRLTVIQIDCPQHGRPAWMTHPPMATQCDSPECRFCDGAVELVSAQ